MLILYCENLVIDTKSLVVILFGDICKHMALRSLGALCLVESWGLHTVEISTCGPSMPTDSDKIWNLKSFWRGCIPTVAQRQQMVNASNADLPCSFCKVIGASLLAAWSSKVSHLHGFGWIMHSWLYTHEKLGIPFAQILHEKWGVARSRQISYKLWTFASSRHMRCFGQGHGNRKNAYKCVSPCRAYRFGIATPAVM